MNKDHMRWAVKFVQAAQKRAEQVEGQSHRCTRKTIAESL